MTRGLAIYLTVIAIGAAELWLVPWWRARLWNRR
jgi:hypothetical protein